MAHEQSDNDQHEWGVTTMVTAQFVDGYAPPNVVDGKPIMFKAGTGIFSHTCTVCGKTETWTV